MTDAERLSSLRGFAAAFSRGELDLNYFVCGFLNKLTVRTAPAALAALEDDQANAVRDHIDLVELWDRDVDRLWPLAGGAAVEEELLRWRFASAAGPAGERFAAGELDPAAVPALLAALDRSADLRTPAPPPAAAAA